MKETYAGLVNTKFQNLRICKIKNFHGDILSRSHKGNQNDIRLLKNNSGYEKSKNSSKYKEKLYSQRRILYPAKLSVRHMCKMKTLSDMQSLQSFASTVPFFHEAIERYVLPEDSIVLRLGNKRST